MSQEPGASARRRLREDGFEISMDDDMNATADLLRCNSFDFVVARAKVADTLADTQTSEPTPRRPSPVLRRGPGRVPLVATDPVNRESHHGLVISEPYPLDNIELDDLFQSSPVGRRAQVADGEDTSTTNPFPGPKLLASGTVNLVAEQAAFDLNHERTTRAAEDPKELEEGRSGQQHQGSDSTITRLIKKLVSLLGLSRLGA